MPKPHIKPDEIAQMDEFFGKYRRKFYGACVVNLFILGSTLAELTLPAVIGALIKEVEDGFKEIDLVYLLVTSAAVIFISAVSEWIKVTMLERTS